MKESDLVFSVHRSSGNPNPVSLYVEFLSSFAKTLDRMGKGTREDGNERRREITLHSFRRFVKTTISDLGYQDFSEYFIGHSGSTYWTNKESEKAEIFRKNYPYVSKCPSTREAGCRYSKQNRGTRRTKSVIYRGEFAKWSEFLQLI